jgi:hypothetical protein
LPILIRKPARNIHIINLFRTHRVSGIFFIDPRTQRQGKQIQALSGLSRYQKINATLQ